MKLSSLKKKRILILGLGREGKDTLVFLRKAFPEKVLGIADQKDFKNLDKATQELLKKNKKKIKCYFGKNYLKAIEDYDIVIKAPGIPIHLPEIEKAKKEKKLTSQTEIFFENCKGTIIGVTGTKGKSTTTSLIYKILKSSPELSRKVHLVGNIGKPVLSLLLRDSADDIFCYELSSHQLWNLKHSPHITVFLNIFPEHLDYYKNFQEYARAKANICLWQKKDDFLIYNKEDKNVKKIVEKSKAQKTPLKNYSNILKNVGIKKVPLLGEHNLLNIAAAIKVGKIFKIPNDKIAKAVESFQPLCHRLEPVGTFKGITFYNDSLATIPETTIAAIDAFGDKVETILLGGYDRNLNFEKLAEKILNSGTKTVILFPTTGEKIWQTIEKINRKQKFPNLPKHFFVDPKKKSKTSDGASAMKEAVGLAFENTHEGKICLLSCASSSFSLFRDYKEKGNLFKKWVRYYGKIKNQKSSFTTAKRDGRREQSSLRPSKIKNRDLQRQGERRERSSRRSSKNKHITNSPQETERLGRNFAKAIIKKDFQKAAVVLSLEGELGGGKTTFLKGFAKGLGIKEKIKSPTFIIFRKFPISQTSTNNSRKFENFYHFDCYRIEKPEEILELGFKEVIQSPKNIVAIEWGNKIRKILPKNCIKVKFIFLDKNKRKIITVRN